tara:strand:+ start:3760 stop:4236 length:477 start_codon:yes stop_codon:yes gene_type:complete
MKELTDFLVSHVAANGPVKALVSGGSIDAVDGVTQVQKGEADVYVVLQPDSIDPAIADATPVVVYVSDSKLNMRPNSQPEAVMGKKPHGQNILSEQVVVYSTSDIVKPEPEPEIRSTLPPEDVGVAFSISGEDSTTTPGPEEEGDDNDDDGQLEPRMW